MANSSPSLALPESPALGATAHRAPAVGVKPAAQYDMVRFALRPNPKFLRCLAQYPDDPTRQPFVRVAIVQGSLDDELFLVGRYIKPNLRFEIFTVEHTPLLTDGTVDPSFSRFGLAWYHGHLEPNDAGILSTNIRAVLLDQFFGFDATIRLAPAGTFHIGLWFSDPQDVAACGVEVNGPTPFDGGPLAMISVPVAATGLGPLCTHPSIWVSLANSVP